MRSENIHNVSMAVIDRPHVFKVHALERPQARFGREMGQAYKVSGEQRQRQEQDCTQRQAAPAWNVERHFGQYHNP